MTTGADLGSDTRRLELYVRLSVYFLLLTEPLLALGAVPPGYAGPLLALVAVHTLANVLVCRWALTAMRSRPRLVARRDRAGLLAWLVLSVVTVAVVQSAVAGAGWPGVPVLVAGASLAAVSPVLGHRAILASAVVVAPLLAVDGFSATALAAAAVVAVFAAVGLVGLAYTFWLSGWMLRVIWELVEARRRAAQLAVAEERLRIARDLHDLFGRTLAAVAVKSELASELLRRGRPEDAAAEIAAVRGLAEEAGGEVRQVVRGFRRTDLGDELVGARALLDSAGIRCVVHAEGADRLAPEAAAALAWTLREAVTNVIRHSEARECFITLDAGDPVRLVVTNDGAPRVPADGAGSSGGPHGPDAGSGLIGMAERLTAVGGGLVRHQADRRFTVEARVPAARAYAAEVSR